MIGTNVFIGGTANANFGKSPVAIRCFQPYPNYPVAKKVFPLATFHIEGHVYCSDHALHSALELLADSADKKQWDALTAQLPSLHQYGGEYACWVVTATHLLFFNDKLGRLPVYCCQHNQRLFVGRSLHALFEAWGRPDADALGLTQMLWSGFNVGNRSIFQHIHTIPPGSIMAWNLASLALDFQFQQPLDFSKKHTSAGVEQNGVRLAELFVAGCRSMVQTIHGPWHVSLSGGQDSRASLAGIVQASQQVSASTFAMPGAEKDVSVAGQLARLAKVPWTAIPIQPECHHDTWILQAKQGYNYAGMAFIRCHLQQVAGLHPGATLITGDGGDVIMQYYGEPSRPPSPDHLVRSLLWRHAVNDPKKVCSLFGLHLDELAQSIFLAIQAYPEQDLNLKSIHFSTMERVGRSYFEGEDRNRHFLWSTSPFYHPLMFDAAMQVPDHQKKNYRLYRHFMQHLAPQWAKLPDASGGAMGHWYFHLRKWAREHMRSTPFPIKTALRNLNKALQPAATKTPRPALQLPDAWRSFVNEDALVNMQQSSTNEGFLHLKTLTGVFTLEYPSTS